MAVGHARLLLSDQLVRQLFLHVVRGTRESVQLTRIDAGAGSVLSWEVFGMEAPRVNGVADFDRVANMKT